MIPQLYETFAWWSKGGSVYVFSDPHFGDPDCKLMDPSWVSPREQINVINETVNKNDTLILLGDLGDANYVWNIKAKTKILVLGNHDKNPGSPDYRIGDRNLFDDIYEGPLFIGQRLLLSHEPVMGLDFCLNIHGHDHSGAPIDDYHLNVAANVVDYRPVNLGKVLKNGILHDIPNIHRKAIDRQKGSATKEAAGSYRLGALNRTDVFYVSGKKMDDALKPVATNHNKALIREKLKKYEGRKDS